MISEFTLNWWFFQLKLVIRQIESINVSPLNVPPVLRKLQILTRDFSFGANNNKNNKLMHSALKKN